jgi:hypothetical protein
MARAIFPHEVMDPDFQWLIKNYCESGPPVAVIDSGCLPLVLVLLDERARALSNPHVLGIALSAENRDCAQGSEEAKKG